MARERLLITVKTYPTLSRKYGETVCTAAVRQDGTWVRIYPVPFRRLDEKEQYRKFDWIECDLVKSRTDPRPESHHPVDVKQLQAVAHIGTEDDWRERRRLLLRTARVYTRLQTLIDGAKANALSLAVFKPTKITDFVWEEEEREWDGAKVAKHAAGSDPRTARPEDRTRAARGAQKKRLHTGRRNLVQEPSRGWSPRDGDACRILLCIRGLSRLTMGADHGSDGISNQTDRPV